MIAFLFTASCGTPQKTETKNTGKAADPASPPAEPEKSKENILDSDPFFTAEPMPSEYFRVLITDDGYFVKNMGKEGIIERKEDIQGDKEQFNTFHKFSVDYSFKDWSFDAVMRVRLNPHRGELEHIEYVPGRNPKTWQSGKLFQEDLSRFHFDFPDGKIPTHEFLVSYLWRIQKKPGLSEEDAKKMAIEFLNSQLRKQ